MFHRSSQASALAALDRLVGRVVAVGRRWLVNPERLPDYVLARLLTALFDRTVSLAAGALVVEVVAVAAIVRTGEAWAIAWLLIDIATTMARISTVWAYQRGRWSLNPRVLERRAFMMMIFGLIWAATLGAGCFMCLHTGDPVLALLSSVVVTGVIGAFTFRNGGIPRYALLQMTLCEAPLCLGMLTQADPWTWLLALKSPFYALGMANIVNDNARVLATTILAEHETKALAARLDAAVVNMPVGLLMFEVDRGLQVWNGRAGEVMGIEANALERGTALRSLLLSAAVVPDPEDELDCLVARLECDGSEAQVFLADGRVLLLMGKRGQGGLLSVMVKDVTERHREDQRISQLAKRDALTGLSNRNEFNECLAERYSAETDAPFSLLFIDLDGFKNVNDTFGHQAGDRLLCEVAASLTRLVPPGSLVARLGGDEFAAIVPFNLAGALLLAQRIVDVIAEPFALDPENSAVVGASIGLAHGPQEGVDAELLQSHADRALYAAKAAGRGVVRVFNPSYERRAVGQHEDTRQARTS